jgi:putative PIN family toxin of toxin-antitoxin system
VKSSKNKIRIVLDTNILISAIVFGGKPRQILNMLAENSVTVVIAEELLTELRRKIISKFPDFSTDLAAIEKLLKRDAVVVKLGTVHVNVSRDPDDDKFIEVALIAKCDYIVSGDKDLLVIGQFKKIKIISPSYFLKIFDND